MGLVYAGIVWLSHQVQATPGEFPAYFYGLILFMYALHQVRGVASYHVIKASQM